MCISLHAITELNSGQKHNSKNLLNLQNPHERYIIEQDTMNVKGLILVLNTVVSLFVFINLSYITSAMANLY